MLSLESNNIIPFKIPVTKQKRKQTSSYIIPVSFFSPKEQKEMFFQLSRGGLWVTLRLTQNQQEVVSNPPAVQLNGPESEVWSKDHINCLSWAFMSQSTRSDTMASSGRGGKVACYLRQLHHGSSHSQRQQWIKSPCCIQ